MSFAITREAKGVYVKWSGKITGEDFLRAVHVVNNSPDFDMYYYVINDAVGCEAIDLTALSMENAIAGAIGAHVSNPKFVAAFVASEQAISEVWLSIAKVTNDYMRTAVFGDLAEARNWALTAPRN